LIDKNLKTKGGQGVNDKKEKEWCYISNLKGIAIC